MIKEVKRMKPADEESPAVSVKRKEVVGIFINNWKIIVSYGHNSMNSVITSFRAGQLVWDTSKIEDYINQGAPLRVYSRDID